MTTVIYAHRGASGKAPENTMAAFRIALSEEAEGIETDVQLTKDGVPVLIHDERLRRTTGTGGYVKDVTYQQIKALNANAGFPTEVNTPVPSLEEFLEWAKDKPLHLNLELKNNKITYRHLEDIVLKQLDAYNLLDRTVISSFNPLSLKKIETDQSRYRNRIAYRKTFCKSAGSGQSSRRRCTAYKDNTSPSEAGKSLS
ncbi:glycerophosphodiester phosphodiesterase family protein [Virgibacillus halophilus]|uniref:Glycerophosphodiester phosphodiesterase family protein n=1 Tax=Tigheibacillus halophilus TaxID=361280 RepID=A0ABU5CB21_9BACI|nr:glycerophosphodiester phosphodiesterase family protein [Virgibacillus halophilus]